MKNNKYIDFLELKGASKAAVNAARAADNLFKKWTGGNLSRATSGAVKKFVKRAQEEAKNEAQKRTFIQRYNTARQIARFYNNFNAQKMFDAIDIKRALKAESRSFLSEDWTAKAFSDEERSAIVAAVKGCLKPRWFMPLILLYNATGARLSELANLRFCDVLNGGAAIIVMGKGRKARRAEIIDEEASDALADYISYRYNERYSQPVADDYIFRTQKLGSLHVSPRAVEQQFDRLLIRLGIKGRGRSIHCFRHTFISAAIEGGAPVHIVAAQVGHANINTTIQYYTHTRAATIRNELRRAKERREEAPAEGLILAG